MKNPIDPKIKGRRMLNKSLRPVRGRFSFLVFSTRSDRASPRKDRGGNPQRSTAACALKICAAQPRQIPNFGRFLRSGNSLRVREILQD